MTSTELTTTTAGAPAEWQSKLDLVKSMVAKGCTNDEFALLCHLAKTYQLDPLAREIWAIRYGNNPAQIFVGHAGLINLALRSGKLDGMKCEILNVDSDDPVAKATVWRNDMSHPIEAEVYWSEYGKDAKNPLWKTKPRTMLRKTAEVHALRRAFALSGLYTEEEMDHAPVMVEVPDTSTPVPVKVQPKVVKAQVTSPTSGAGSPVQCGRCGASMDADPTIRIVNRDGAWMCLACLSEGTQTELPAKVQPKTVETGVTPPANGIPAPEIGAEFVCEECGTQMTASEQHASKIMLGRLLCKTCMQTWSAQEKVGA